ncbi:hypothetical protein TKK_0006346 [Trichogramma kaykai]
MNLKSRSARKDKYAVDAGLKKTRLSNIHARLQACRAKAWRSASCASPDGPGSNYRECGFESIGRGCNPTGLAYEDKCKVNEYLTKYALRAENASQRPNDSRFALADMDFG